ncbi:MAG: XrtA system polysaccharide deacetylase [Motiliproteus sp.]
MTQANALTIDVEDYFHVSAFEAQCPPSSWKESNSRVVANVNRLLDLLDGRQTKATFFVLGWVAERHQGLVRDISERGHEVASHGSNHQRINRLNQLTFREDVCNARKLLQDISGQKVQGYRAPSFSFSEQTAWAQEELLAAGYLYSSSINPVPHDLYGYPDAPRKPFHWENGLLEVPVTTCQYFGRRIPCAGGGYFRLYPYPVFRWLMLKACQQLDEGAIFYLHPWEIDPDQPRIDGASLKSRFRHYINLDKTEARFERLLEDFQWGPLAELSVVRQVISN